MNIELKGKDMILVSKLIKKLKLRTYLKDLKANLKDQDINNFDTNLDMGLIMGDLIIYICEEIADCIEEIDSIIKSTLNKTNEDLINMTYEEKATITVEIIKKSIPKNIMDSLQILSVKKNQAKNNVENKDQIEK